MASIPLLFWLAPVAAFVALVAAYVFFLQVRTANPGDAALIREAAAVKREAYALLRRQMRAEFLLVVVLVAALIPFVLIEYLSALDVVTVWLGALAPAFAGLLAAVTALSATNRVVRAARQGEPAARSVAIRAGAAGGLALLGLMLLEGVAWFLFVRWATHRGCMPGGDGADDIAEYVLDYLLGSAVHALFAGGAGELLCRSRDAFADAAGDAVQLVRATFGRAADLYGVAASGVVAAVSFGGFVCTDGTIQETRSLILPYLVAAVGVVAALLAVFTARRSEETLANTAGFARAGAYAVIGIGVAGAVYFPSEFAAWDMIQGAFTGFLVLAFCRLVGTWRVRAADVRLDLLGVALYALAAWLLIGPLGARFLDGSVAMLYGFTVSVAGAGAAAGVDFLFSSAFAVVHGAASLARRVDVGTDTARAVDGMSRELGDPALSGQGIIVGNSLLVLVSLLFLFIAELAKGSSDTAFLILSIRTGWLAPAAGFLAGLTLAGVCAVVLALARDRAAEKTTWRWCGAFTLLAILLPIAYMEVGEYPGSVAFQEGMVVAAGLVALVLPNLAWLWARLARVWPPLAAPACREIPAPLVLLFLRLMVLIAILYMIFPLPA